MSPVYGHVYREEHCTGREAVQFFVILTAVGGALTLGGVGGTAMMIKENDHENDHTALISLVIGFLGLMVGIIGLVHHW